MHSSTTPAHCIICSHRDRYLLYLKCTSAHYTPISEQISLEERDCPYLEEEEEEEEEDLTHAFHYRLSY